MEKFAQDRPLALYVHVPFCKRKCVYCDFASYAGCEGRMDAYFQALYAEMDAWLPKLKAYRVRSVFFGGGTPSLVPAEKIAESLARLKDALPFADDAEITLEANPGTLDMQKLSIYRSAGVNRLSIGVQSFDGRVLESIGRIHTPQEAEAAVWMAREAGFSNISIDLMYALPDQDMKIWSETLDRAVTLPISHISAYSLIVEPNTEMERRVRAGIAKIADDDTVNEMQRMAICRLQRAGFARYEISNFAKVGRESRHNLIYWTGGEYLGLGSAAHSLLDNVRFCNPPELERYISGERCLERSLRSLQDQKEETLMLSTRLIRGLDLAAWERDYSESFVEKHERQIEKLLAYDLIQLQNGFLRLTPAGLELQDSVVLELMD